MSERSPSLWLRLPDGVRSRTGSNPVPLPTSGRLVFGSGSEADVQLTGDGLASEHALIAPLKDGGHGLRGLVDDNLPRRAGQSVRAVRLGLGDEFEIGAHRFTVEAAPSTRRALDISLPGFQVLRQIGRGAQARVYLATQESLDREVALKVLRADLGRNTAFVKRFQAEARAAAALHHANVVTVFDVLEHEGTHLLVMEHMERGSLEDRLGKEGALPWRAVLGILRDAASGLEFAESRGLVHRDIKPANLMQNAAGVTKIADLGLATASETDDERIVGTPHFMAPEQARGGAADARADLYALGSTAYRLLSARTPFEGQNGREILRNKLSSSPPQLAEYAPDCPPGLIALVEDLMAPDPNDRPDSAARVKSRIEELARDSASGGSARAEQTGSRGWIPVTIGAVSLILAGVGGWLAFGGGEIPNQSGGQQTTDSDARLEVTDSGSGSDPAPNTNSGNAPNHELPWNPNQRLAGSGSFDGSLSDEDAALRDLEQEASVELAAALASADSKTRELELRAVAEQYAGTDAARRAGEALLSSSESGDVQQDQGLALVSERALVAYLAEARQAATQSGRWLPPHQAIAELEGYSPPPGTVDELAFNEAREELASIAREDLSAQARESIERVREDLIAGRLAEARAQLATLFDWCVAPPLDEALKPHYEAPSLVDNDRSTWPTALRELPEITRAVQDAYAGLDELEELYQLAQHQADRRILANAIGPTSSFAEWAALEDPEEAVALVNKTLLAVKTPEARHTLVVLARALEDAAAARVALMESFGAGRWKRVSIRLPGDRRGGAEVLVVDARGLVTEDEIFPLVEYGREPESVHLLFDTRIEGDWSPFERRAAASWIFISALLRAQADLAERLDGHRGRLKPAAIAGEFELVIPWTQGGAESSSDESAAELQALAARGAIASSRLADGLDAARRGDAVRGAFQLEQTLRTQFDHPLVIMLTDGTPLDEPVDWSKICAEWMP